MASVLAVDLAAKYSAVCWMADTGAVLSQWDSWGITETAFVDTVARPWRSLGIEAPEVMLIEDLPHRLPFASLVKAVCRLQGRIVQAMDEFDVAGRIVFVPPFEWRKTFPGLERGTGPYAVVPVAKILGYQAPDLTNRTFSAKDRATARKVSTDYCAAFLIAHWATDARATRGTYDMPGTSRYPAPAQVLA